MVCGEGFFPGDDFFVLIAKMFDDEFGWVACGVVSGPIVAVNLEEVRSVGVVMPPGAVEVLVGGDEVADAAIGVFVVEPLVVGGGGGIEVGDRAPVADVVEGGAIDVFDVGFEPFDGAGFVNAAGDEGLPGISGWVLLGVGHG